MKSGFAVRNIHRGSRSYSQHLFTDDRAVISRDLRFTGPVIPVLRVIRGGRVIAIQLFEARLPPVMQELSEVLTG
ncbi:MAG: hypothetical protein LUQ50_00710 [Methanospirillum sp.]|uniref:hypothetical protein n=1 Tax=Methanospirillum sp. TaxID=45200 RepID=UPI002373385C|nr:hypothetical protein [Methanospirillum sp.]MDD1727573.1 hypothetical protein [Methanospirillum sp.]